MIVKEGWNRKLVLYGFINKLIELFYLYLSLMTKKHLFLIFFLILIEKMEFSVLVRDKHLINNMFNLFISGFLFRDYVFFMDSEEIGGMSG